MKFSNLIAAVAMIFLSVGCAHTPSDAGSRDCTRIATYNVNYGINPATLIETLGNIDAEIICLQEADGLETAYRKALSNRFPYIYVKGTDGNLGAGYALLSKFPAHEIAFVRNNDWFGGWIVKIESPLGPIQILSVHLHPPLKKRSWIAGYFLTRGDRLQEMKDFYAAIEPGIPLIVAGDFNDTSHSRAVRFLKRHGLENTLPQFDHFSPTWRWRVGPISLHRRMDHILIGPEFLCKAAFVQKMGDSDHFPVTAEICAVR